MTMFLKILTQKYKTIPIRFSISNKCTATVKSFPKQKDKSLLSVLVWIVILSKSIFDFQLLFENSLNSFWGGITGSNDDRQKAIFCW